MNNETVCLCGWGRVRYLFFLSLIHNHALYYLASCPALILWARMQHSFLLTVVALLINNL